MAQINDRPIKTVSIRHEGNHYVVRIDGEFYCSTDTFGEAVKEVNDMYVQSDAFLPSSVPKFTDAEKFVEEKIKMLKRDFRVHPTIEEIEHLKSLTTEGDINRAVASIIDRHWNETLAK